METEQRILVAFDDSENAMRAVRQVSKFFNPSNKVTLFSVIQDSIAFFNINHPELTPYFLEQQAHFMEIDQQQKTKAEDAQQKAKSILLDAGFKIENITVIAQNKVRGIARDIIAEAETGYDIVVMGRRGLSGIEEFLLGSVSQKVLHSMKHISVLIVS